MDIISVDASNIDKEHIYCAISVKKRETCVSPKISGLLVNKPLVNLKKDRLFI